MEHIVNLAAPQDVIGADRVLYLERRAAVLRGINRTSVYVKKKDDGASKLRSLGYAVAAALAHVLVAMLVLYPTEGWTWLDCAYFCIVTMTTVGYGDLTPKTHAGKITSMILSVSGLVTVTATLNSLINRIAKETKERELIESLKRLDEAVANEKSPRADGDDSGESFIASVAQSLNTAARGRWRVLRWVSGTRSSESGGMESVECGQSLARCVRSALQWLAPVRPVLDWTTVNLGPLLGALAAGACVGRFAEGWSTFDSVYYSLISILTVGFGDFSPSSTSGRVLCTLFLPVACGAAVSSIGALSAAVVQLRDKLFDASSGLDTQIRRMESLMENQGLNGLQPVITETDYFAATLLELELVDAETVAKIRAQFYRLDKCACHLERHTAPCILTTVAHAGTDLAISTETTTAS